MNHFLIILRMIADYAWLIWGFVAIILWTDLWVSVPLFVGYLILILYTEILFRKGR